MAIACITLSNILTGTDRPPCGLKIPDKVMMEMHGFAYTHLGNFFFSRVRADGSYRNTR